MSLKLYFHPLSSFCQKVLVALYEWTKNLLAPILLHAMFNAVNFALIVAHPQWSDHGPPRPRFG